MNKTYYVILLVVSASMCRSLIPQPCHAQTKLHAANAQSTRNESPALVPSGDGGVIVLWRSVMARGCTISAQKFDKHGKEVWKNGGVDICTQPTNDANFSAVTDTRGGVIVFWEDTRGGKYASDIYAQRLDASGRPVWESGGVPVCTARHQQLFPHAVVDQHGGAYAFWTDYRNGNADIYGCHTDSNGKVIRKFAVCTESEDQMHLSVAASPSGGACVVWVDHRYDNPGIYAELIDASDSVCWRRNGLPICTGLYQPESPSVSAVGNGRFLFTWDDYRDRVAKVFLQLVDADGKEAKPSNGVSVRTSGGPQYSPSICVTSSSGAAVTWLQYGKGAEMLQQRMDLSGNVRLKPEVQLSKASLAQLWVRSVPDGSGGVVCVWLKYAGDRTEVFAQRTDSQGRLNWGRDGLLLGPAGGEAHPRVLSSGPNRILFVSWTKRSGTSSKIIVVALAETGSRIWKGQL